MSIVERLFAAVLFVLVVAVLGCTWYGQWSARRQPGYELGKHDDGKGDP